jgi:hypothetical protein
MGPTVDYQLEDTCCRWCHVLEGIAIIVVAVMKAAAAEVVVVQALVLGAQALASEGLLWPIVAQLALHSLARSVAA